MDPDERSLQKQLMLISGYFKKSIQGKILGKTHRRKKKKMIGRSEEAFEE